MRFPDFRHIISPNLAPDLSLINPVILGAPVNCYYGMGGGVALGHRGVGGLGKEWKLSGIGFDKACGTGTCTQPARKATRTTYVTIAYGMGHF